MPAQINPTQVRPDAMYAAVISPVDICCGYFSLWLLSPVDNWYGYCPPWTSAVVILSWTSVAVISPVDICVKLSGKCSSSCSSSVVIQSKECAASCLQNPATSVPVDPAHPTSWSGRCHTDNCLQPPVPHLRSNMSALWVAPETYRKVVYNILCCFLTQSRHQSPSGTDRWTIYVLQSVACGV